MVRLDSDNVAAYMQLLASAYIRLSRGTHGSVFQSSSPPIDSSSDYLPMSTERLDQGIGASCVCKTISLY